MGSQPLPGHEGGTDGSRPLPQLGDDDLHRRALCGRHDPLEERGPHRAQQLLPQPGQPPTQDHPLDVEHVHQVGQAEGHPPGEPGQDDVPLGVAPDSSARRRNAWPEA